MLTGGESAIVGALAGWMLHVVYNKVSIIKLSKSGWNAILAEAANCYEYVKYNQGVRVLEILYC